jgi:hypothetical protein
LSQDYFDIQDVNEQNQEVDGINNIRIALRQIDDTNLFELDQDSDYWKALVNTVKNLPVQYNVGRFLSSCITGGLLRRAHLYEVSYNSSL